jgi:hypothetical protein
MLCLAEEEARRWVAGCSEQERGWVPRRGLEGWLGLMHEVEVLRLPLAFGRARGAHGATPLDKRWSPPVWPSLPTSHVTDATAK